MATTPSEPPAPLPRRDPRYEDTLKKLFVLKRFGVKLDLQAPRQALAQLGDPQRAYPSIHLGGTNGKGSTAAMVAEILQRGGHRVGLFTSPHLNRFTERIRINGEEIHETDVVELFDEVSRLDPDLTFFERTALMAFTHFARNKVDVAVVEVGLGGRLDVTNLVRPVATGILQIGADHTAYLGREISRIAWEKAGILRPGVPLAMAPGESPTAQEVLRRMAKVRGAPVHEHGKDFQLSPVGPVAAPSSPMEFHGPGGPLKVPGVGLMGAHQHQNAAVALTLTGLLPAPLQVSPEARIGGVSEVRWPGRGELLRDAKGKRVLLDAGHNPDGVRALSRLVGEIPHENLHVVVGAMGDKDLEATLSPLVGIADSVVVTQAAYYRACGAEELRKRVLPLTKKAEVLSQTPTRAAIEVALQRAKKDDLVVISGSVFLLGEARGALLEEGSDPFQVTDPVYQPPRPRSQEPSPPKDRAS